MNAQPKPPDNPAPNVPALCAALLAAKQKEDAARESRIATEALLVEALGFDKSDGSKTFNVEGFKVECKAGINYKLNLDKWENVKLRLPPNLRPVRPKLEADPAGCKWLKANEPSLWAVAAEAITAAPAKVGITVTKVEK